MTKLNISSNFSMHDDVYEQIVQLCDGRTEFESLKAVAKVLLLLANHIGDPEIVKDAVSLVMVEGSPYI